MSFVPIRSFTAPATTHLAIHTPQLQFIACFLSRAALAKSCFPSVCLNCIDYRFIATMADLIHPAMAGDYYPPRESIDSYRPGHAVPYLLPVSSTPSISSSTLQRVGLDSLQGRLSPYNNADNAADQIASRGRGSYTGALSSSSGETDDLKGPENAGKDVANDFQRSGPASAGPISRFDRSVNIQDGYRDQTVKSERESSPATPPRGEDSRASPRYGSQGVTRVPNIDRHDVGACDRYYKPPFRSQQELIGPLSASRKRPANSHPPTSDVRRREDRNFDSTFIKAADQNPPLGPGQCDNFPCYGVHHHDQCPLPTKCRGCKLYSFTHFPSLSLLSHIQALFVMTCP